MSKARQLADLGNVYDDGALSNRNLIINGAMQVWQRGTSAAGGSISSFVYIADRFWMYAPSSSSGTISQSTDVPSGEGFIYSLYNNLDTSCSIGTNVELYKVGSDAPFVNGETYTLSFYVKAGSASTGNGISITTRDNSGGTGSVTRASGVTFDITTSWARVVKTFTLSGTVGGSNTCLQVEFGVPAGGYVTGFQLERGDTATPFEHRSYGDELARCQRYFQTFGTSSGNAYGTGAAYRGSTYLSYTMPVTPRATPTLSSAGLWQTSTDGGSYTDRTPSLGGFQGNQLLITAWSGGGYDQDTIVYGRLNLDAEL